MLHLNKNLLLMATLFFLGVLVSTSYWGVRYYNKSIISDVDESSDRLDLMVYNFQFFLKNSRKNFELRFLEFMCVDTISLEHQISGIEKLILMESEKKHYYERTKLKIARTKKIVAQYKNVPPECNELK